MNNALYKIVLQFNISTLIGSANELNSTGVNNFDVGYVCTAGNGGHLLFNTYPDVGEYLPSWWTSKYGCSVWNFVAIVYRSWDMALFHSYFR